MSSAGALSKAVVLNPHRNSWTPSYLFPSSKAKAASSWSTSSLFGVRLQDRPRTGPEITPDPRFGICAPPGILLGTRAMKSTPSIPGPDGSVPKRRRGRPMKRAPLTDNSPEVATTRGGSDGRTPSVATTTLDSPETSRASWGKYECRRPVLCTLRVRSHTLCSGCINLILEQQKKQQHGVTAKGGSKDELRPFAQDDWSHEEPIVGPLPDLTTGAADQRISIGGVTFHRGKQTAESDEAAALPKTFQGLLSMYVSVREEIQSWSDFFKANHGRRPQMSDVAATRIPWLLEKFLEYMKIRDRIEIEARHSVRKAALYAGARGRFALPTAEGAEPGRSSVKVHSSGWSMISKGHNAGPIKAWGSPGLVATSVSLDEVDEWMFSVAEHPQEESQLRLRSPGVGKPVQMSTSKTQVRREQDGSHMGDSQASGQKTAGPLPVDGGCPLLDSAEGQAAISSARGPCAEQWERLGFSTDRERTPTARSRAIAASSAWENLPSRRTQELTLPPDFLPDVLECGSGRPPYGASGVDSKSGRGTGVLGTQDVLGVKTGGSGVQMRFLSTREAHQSPEWADEGDNSGSSRPHIWPLDRFQPQTWAPSKAKESKALGGLRGAEKDQENYQ